MRVKIKKNSLVAHQWIALFSDNEYAVAGTFEGIMKLALDGLKQA